MTPSLKSQQAFWNTVIAIFNEKLEHLANGLCSKNLWKSLTTYSTQPSQDFTKLTDIFFQDSIDEAAERLNVDVRSTCDQGYDMMYFNLRKEIKKTRFGENEIDNMGKSKKFCGWLGNVYQGETKRENDGFIMIQYDINKETNKVDRICVWDVSRDAHNFYNLMTETAAKKLKSMGEKKTKGTAALSLMVPVSDYEHVTVILGGKTKLTPTGRNAKKVFPVMQDC
jgi:hypothetical protein